MKPIFPETLASIIKYIHSIKPNFKDMGKDQNGKYVPPKGKPSGDGVNKAGGDKTVTNWENIEEQFEKEENYTDGPDAPAANVRVMHPNRNVDKEDNNQAYS